METTKEHSATSYDLWDKLCNPNEQNSERDRGLTDARAKRIGEAVKMADTMVEGKIYDMSERSHFSPEEIRNYLDDISSRNIDFLNIIHADESLKRSYREITREFPATKEIFLSQIHDSKLRDEDIQNAYSSPAMRLPDGSVKPVVAFNFKNPDIYLSEMADEKGDLKGFYTVLTEIALRVGAKPSEVAKNRALVSTFVMAHEFGHALDFHYNMLIPEVEKAQKEGRRHVGTVALPEALAKHRDLRNSDMASILSGSIETDSRGDTDLNNILESRYRDLDLRTPSERRIYNKKSYRTCRSENIADSFAMAFVMRHYDRFFYDPRKGEPANGRVATNLYGETKSVGEQLLPLLDFHAGKHVKTRVLSDDGSMHEYDGCLCNSLRRNGDLALNISGNPADNSRSNIEKLGKIRDVRLKQERGKHGAKNTFYLIMDNFSTIELSVSGTGEAPKIDVPPSDLLNRYHLDEGSLICLLKHRVNEGDYSRVSNGGLLAGHLAKNSHGSLIRVGSGIYLNSDQANGFVGGNTSHVKRFYRKWKRYFVETSTSTYEILPYANKRKS